MMPLEDFGVDRTARGGRTVEVVVAAADAREIARLVAENFRKHGHVARERIGEAADARGLRRAAGHERGARRHALGRGGERAVEAQALGGEAVEVGRLDRIAVTANIGRAVVVGENDDDVRARWGGGVGEGGRQEEEREGFHCGESWMRPVST